MTIHHWNCGTMNPRFTKMRSIVYCLLVETNQGLVLVDTGFGTRDCIAPSLRMRFFAGVIGAELNLEETALRRVEGMGYHAEDVRHIVMTHLHLDHTGGLPDFPETEVHVHRLEYASMRHPRGLIARGRDSSHFRHAPKWKFHADCDTQLFGLDAIRVLEHPWPDILLIPLPGHTPGHCGVAVETPEGWLLHCGDSVSPYHAESDIHSLPEGCHALQFLPSRFVRWAIGRQPARLRAVRKAHHEKLEMISSHDHYQFEKYCAAM